MPETANVLSEVKPRIGNAEIRAQRSAAIRTTQIKMGPNIPGGVALSAHRDETYIGETDDATVSHISIQGQHAEVGNIALNIEQKRVTSYERAG